VILPKALRDRHGWTAGTVLEIADGPHGVTPMPVRLCPPTRLEDMAGMLAEFHKGSSEDDRGNGRCDHQRSFGQA
jgi:bifunctional DNA-binding transcriptional regulator/antitoxin component of YhaV-PrlF toxin-antitoxin module